jgi:hypothetical protein
MFTAATVLAALLKDAQANQVLLRNVLSSMNQAVVWCCAATFVAATKHGRSFACSGESHEIF